MKRSLLAVAALAVAVISLASPRAEAACDYAIGGPPLSGPAMIGEINEELACIQAAIAAGVTDGNKGDVIVSGSGSVWTIKSGVTLISPTISSPTGLVKGDVGLGNVDNTSDAAKNAASATLTSKNISGASNTLSNIGNGSLSNMSNGTIKCRVAAGSGAPEDCSGTQATGLLNAMVGDAGSGGTKGLVAAPAAGDAAAGKFWKADGTWAVPSGGGGVSDGNKGDITVTSSGATWTINSEAVGLGKLDVINGNTPANGDCLLARPTGTGGTLEFAACPGAGGGISAVVQDTAPKLGGALDTNGFGIEFGSGNTDTTVVRSGAGDLSIEGNVIYRAGGTDVAVADGGTGASTASGARTNLGLVIGSDVQAWSTNLDTWATKTAPSGAVVGTTDTQTLSGKSISGSSNTITNIGSSAITDGSVANVDLANMAQATVKGRTAGAGTGAPVDLSQTQLTALVNTFSSSLSGAVPASGGGTTLFLRADGWATPPGGSSVVDVQTFNADGTWSKPAGGQKMAMIECIGGGGSGGRRATTGNVGGGGGGAYVWRVVPLSGLGSTEAVTIGPGGASRTTSDTAGASGGDSSFGTWLTAYGGGGGDSQGATTVAPGGTGAGLDAMAGIGSTTMSGATTVDPTLEGVGGGGGGVAANANAAPRGGNSYRGGAGGGAASGNNNTRPGGTSTFAGNGGASSSTANATAGSAPGGGGGAARGFNSGAGAAGRCVATSF